MNEDIKGTVGKEDVDAAYICSLCSCADTTILGSFSPESEDTDQRSGYQVECNNCHNFWDVYYTE